MTDLPGHSDHDLSQSILERFRAEWEAGRSPRLAEFLEGISGEQRKKLLRALLNVVLEHARDSEETLSASLYDLPAPEEKQFAIDFLTGELGCDTSFFDESEIETIVPKVAEDTAPTFVHPVDGSRSRESVDAPLKQLGDYELIEEIARGGMGIVYKASQKHLKRTVAIKLILSGQFASNEEVKRFYAEAESAARLEHPNIVPIYECGQQDEHHYFSMGYVNGPSLSQVVRERPMSPQEAAGLMEQIADAVAYAHSKGIVHRDLKPANILMDVGSRPRITDFGLAKSVQSDSGMTATGQVLGTPSYMPPEQASGQIENINEKSDVYSLGAVLYEMLVGRPPFRASSVIETLKQVVEHPPASLRQFDPSIDRDLETICLKCLEKEQENRYASAKELADELRRYLNGEPIVVRPVGPAIKLYRWCRRKPLAVALVASVVLLTVAAFFSVRLFDEFSRTRTISSLEKRFRSELDEMTLTGESYRQAEQTLDRIGQLRPESVKDSRLELDARFADLLDRETRRPALTDDDLKRIEAVLTFFETRNSARAALYRERMTSIRSDWISLGEWKSPLRFSETLFFPKDAKLDSNGQLIVNSNLEYVEEISPAGGRSLRAPRLDSQVLGAGDLRMIVEFASTWEQAHELAARFTMLDGKNYEFRLRARQDRLDLESKTNANLSTFAQNRTSREEIFVEILRNGSPMSRLELSLDRIDAGSLVLRATREGQSLSMQINSLTPIQFYDPFPLPLHDSYRFGLRVTPNVPLNGLTLQRRDRKSISELERADEVFSRGEYLQAHEIYNTQAREFDEKSLQQEARYKQAVCLTRLNRLTEAEDILGELLIEPGENWPSLAGLQLWLMNVRANDLVGADSVFTVISQRVSFAELAALLPQDLRQELLSVHLAEMRKLDKLYEVSPQRLSNLERVAEIDRYLSPDGRGTLSVQEDVYRGYLLMGDYTSALQRLHELQGKFDTARTPMRIARIYNILEQPEEALKVLDDYLTEQRGLGRQDDPSILIARVRALFHSKRDAEATRELHRVLEITDPVSHPGPDPYVRAHARLLEGFRHLDFGDKDRAIAVWKAGFEESRKFLELVSVPGKIDSGVLYVISMGVFSGEASEQDLHLFYRYLALSGSNSTFAAMVESLGDSAKIPELLRAMWLTPYGREFARSLTYQSIELREYVLQAMTAAGISFFEQRALQRAYVRAEEPILIALFQKMYSAYFEERRIQGPQLMQLALTWKGTTNFLGWAGVEKVLSDDVRELLAYFAGYRMLRLNRPKDAEMFFSIAASQNRDANLKTLAEHSLEMLNSEKGMLFLNGPSERELIFELRAEGIPVAELNWPIQKSVSLPKGKYQLQPKTADSGILLSQNEVEISPVGFFEIDFHDLARPSSAVTEFRGLVSQPAEIPRVPEWNILSRSPHSSGPVAWSPKGDLIAQADSTGMIRVFDTESGQLRQVLDGHTDRVRDLIWSHDESLLASCGHDHRVNIWQNGALLTRFEAKTEVLDIVFDTKSNLLAATVTYHRKIVLIDPNSNNRQELLTDAGFTQGVELDAERNRVIAGTNSNKLVVWDRDSARVLNEVSLPQRTSNAIAISPDRKRILVAGEPKGDGPRLSLWNIESWEMLGEATGDLAIHSIQWSPDGRYIAVGGNAGVVEILNGETLEILSKVKTPTRWEYTSWAPDGAQLVTSGLERFTWNGAALQIEQATERLSPRLIFGDWNSVTDELILADDQFNVSIVAPNGRSSQEFRCDERGTHLRDVKWLPSGDGFFILFNNLFELWERDRHSWKRSRSIIQWGGESSAFSPDGTRLAIGDYHGSVRILSAPFREGPILQEKQQPLVAGLCWTSDGKHLVTLSHPGRTVKIRNPDGNIETHLELKDFALRGLATARDPDSVWCATADSRLIRLKLDGLVLDSSKLNRSGVLHLAGLPDGSRTACAFWRGAALVSNESGNSVADAESLRAPHVRTTFQRNCKRLLLFTESGLAVVWDLERNVAESTFVRLASGLTHFSSSGEALIIPANIDGTNELVYLVRNQHGGFDQFTRVEFQRRIETN